MVSLSDFSGNAEYKAAVLHFNSNQTPILENLNGATTVTLSGEETWMEPGDPLLPVHPTTILLPPGMRIDSLTVKFPDAGEILAQGLKLAAAAVSDPSAATHLA